MEDIYIDSKLVCSCSIDSENPLPAEDGARFFLKKHGYLIIKNLYDPSNLAFDFNIEDMKKGGTKKYLSKDIYVENKEENQVPGSYSLYNNPHHKDSNFKIKKLLEIITGEKLYSTYYYERFYFEGQRLIRHTDRDSCEVSVSVQIQTNGFDPWPFCIKSRNGEEHSIVMQNGWGILYLGCEREHWRDPLPSRYSKLGKIINKLIFKKDDTYHHQIFFHYVKANGERSHFSGDSCS